MKRILLDMDGVLADFLSGAIAVLNKEYDRSVTIEEYAKEYGKWGTYNYYGITEKQFWKPIHGNPTFWIDLKPFPWTHKFYTLLSGIGEVTIVTAPSEDPDCSKQKLEWLKRELNISPKQVFLGHRKYLMAGNGVLIDDYHRNVESFQENGGQAILVPANWNTPNLEFEQVWRPVLRDLVIINNK